MSLRNVRARLKKLHLVALSIAMALLMSANTALTRSLLIGTIASVIFFIIVSYLFGKTFFSNDKMGLARFTFGIFVVICVLVIVGTLVNVVYELNFLGLAAVLFAPIGLLAILGRFKKQNVATKDSKTAKKSDFPYFSLPYVLFIGLIAYCTFLLVEARSGWVRGTVWDAISPSFFIVYFLAAFVLIGIILFSQTKPTSKVLSIIAFSLVSILVIAIVLYPDNYGDQSEHLGLARIIFDYGSLKQVYVGPVGALWHVYFLVKEKGLGLFIGILAKMSFVDVYWIHTFIPPLLWSVFVPMTSYKVTKILSGKERVSILAAFLTAFYSIFIHWGSRSTTNALGFIFFFTSLYFILLYLKSDGKKMLLSLAFFACLASFFIHRLPGMMSFICLFLAVNLRIFQTTKLKSRFLAYLQISISLLISIMAIPAGFSFNNLIYAAYASQHASEAITAFSLEKLLTTDVWALIFGGYVDFSFMEIIIDGIIPALGIVGLAYSLKRTKRTRSNGILPSFMLLALLICLIDYRLFEYAMVNVLFGSVRIWAMRDFIIIPFAALTIDLVVQFLGINPFEKPKTVLSRLGGLKINLSASKVFAGVFIGLSLSSLAVSSIYEGYAWLRGLHPTALELEAVKYIDNHTDENYVVFADPTTAMVGTGIVGSRNPEKYYVGRRDLIQNPSVVQMEFFMKTLKAPVGYFIASSFRTLDFDRVTNEAYWIFSLFATIKAKDEEIRIFYYRIPPLPPDYPNPNADIMAFHWGTPQVYIIQNGLMKVIVNPASGRADVRDHWGDLYESVDLNEILVDGENVGTITSIEYYSLSNGTWFIWDPNQPIPYSPFLAQEFRFRLNFNETSLVGVVERGEPSLRMWFEGAQQSTFSLQVGDFSQLYIPGLVSGVNAYNVRLREFGLLYTLSRTEDVVLHPVYESEVSYSNLTYTTIESHSNLILGDGYLTYDFYIENQAIVGQWGFVELWLPDQIYKGVYPPVSYSLDDGETWSDVLGYSKDPIITYGGTEVNWIVSRPRETHEIPTVWSYSVDAEGGSPILPTNFTNSGGGQNRLLFGLALPAGDKALVRLGVSIYYLRPLEITYVFDSSDNILYGLQNMEKGVIKWYTRGLSVYVGGLASTKIPTSLDITEDEAGWTKSIKVEISGDAILFLLSANGVNTVSDANGNGVPDAIEE